MKMFEYIEVFFFKWLMHVKIIMHSETSFFEGSIVRVVDRCCDTCIITSSDRQGNKKK